MMDTPTTTMDAPITDADPSDAPTLPEFARNFCSATISRDRDGYHFEIDCDLSTPAGKREFHRRYPLTPIIDEIAARIRDYHSSLHGETMATPLTVAVNGLADKAAALLFSEVLPILPYATPWGAFVKAASTVLSASQGDRQAQEKIRRVRQLASEGSDAARNLVRTVDKLQRFIATPRGRQITAGHDPYAMDGPPGLRADEMDIGRWTEIGIGRWAEISGAIDEMDVGAPLCIGKVLHIPYRSPLQAIADGNPGMGLTFRQLYKWGTHRG